MNAAKFHETALHHAARVEMVDMIELLVDFGGNVYVTDNDNKKPIDYTKPGSPTEQCLQYYESKSRGNNIFHLCFSITYVTFVIVAV